MKPGIYAKGTGWGGDDLGNARALLTVERVSKGAGLNYKIDLIGEFALRYLPDSNEVVLSKGDEILYSELLSE